MSTQGKGRSNHYVQLWIVLHVQQLYDVATAGALIGHDCQGHLKRNLSVMVRLEERFYDG